MAALLHLIQTLFPVWCVEIHLVLRRPMELIAGFTAAVVSKHNGILNHWEWFSEKSIATRSVTDLTEMS